ncbi:P4H isoform 1 [Prunus dulcis]|uniref:P4H isoform 1 n=1 Tax=Prunus dulcis TaxID=3755 RepID=A0A4Y1QNS9_PRUDU|nr:P4H isoform 1 [Prunus dulcis]
MKIVLCFNWHLYEDWKSSEFPSPRRVRRSLNDGYLELPGGSHWNNDKEAKILRLGYVQPEIISWSPRIIVLHNFLSMEECDNLRTIASPRLEVSTVVDTKTGKGIKSSVRTSSGMFLSHEEKKYPTIQAIEKRISVYSQVPVENGELIQFNLKRGGQRVATILMYLSDIVEGGETYFPLAGSGECSCGGKVVRGLSVKPVKGDAVLFWSMGLDGQSDPNSIHGGCEVLAGEKWSATKWMRQRTTS